MFLDSPYTVGVTFCHLFQDTGVGRAVSINSFAQAQRLAARQYDIIHFLYFVSIFQLVLDYTESLGKSVKID